MPEVPAMRLWQFDQGQRIRVHHTGGRMGPVRLFRLHDARQFSIRQLVAPGPVQEKGRQRMSDNDTRDWETVNEWLENTKEEGA
jgi:hypothetical protein